MPKTNYVPVQGLDPIGGEHPVGVQTRFKAITGPFIPRSIEARGGVVTISMWHRGDVGSKHIDDLPVQREDLVSSDHVEVTGDDLQTIYEIYRRAKGDRERLITEAGGYDTTTVTPAAQGPEVHVDGDGTVLTPHEVAARQGIDAGPTLDEADAWWEDQVYHPDVAYLHVAVAELVDIISEQGATLSEVEYIAVLEHELADGGRPQVLDAINARLAAHAEAANAPGLPLEDGLPIVEVRNRLDGIGDRRVVEGLLDAERKGKGRKRVLAALEARLDQIGEAPAVEPLPEFDGEQERVAEGTGEEMVAVEGDTLPPLPGEEGAVAEDPFG